MCEVDSLIFLLYVLLFLHFSPKEIIFNIYFSLN